MKRKMVYIGISYIVGLFFASLFSLDIQITLALFILLASAVFCMISRKKFVYFAVCAVFFSLGTAAFDMYDHYVYEEILSFEGQDVFYSGKVTEIKNYADDRSCYKLSGKINSSVNADIIYYGDTVKCDFYDTLNFRCTLNGFENTYLFKTKDYYRSCGIFLETDDAYDIEVCKNENFSFMRMIYHYREYTGKRISAILSGDVGAFITAMLIGDKSGIDESSKSALYKCGTGHMLAVSGIHLVIITSIAVGILRKFKMSKKAKAVSAIIFTILFAVFSGMSVSAMRASLMMILVYGAEIFDRQTDPLNSLCIVAFILVLPQPFLIGNTSFLLSASGTFGACVLAPSVTKNMNDENIFKRFMKNAVSVFCISLSVFPFEVMFLDEVSLISPVSDILLIPLCTFSLVCGFVTAVCGGVSFIAYPVLIAGGLSAKFVLKMSELLASSFPVSMPLKRNYMPALTLILTVFVIFTWLRFKKGKYTGAALAVSAVLMFFSSSLYNYMNRDVISVYRVGTKKSAALVVSKGRNADIIDMTGGSGSSGYVSKLLNGCGIKNINSVSFMKNPYQSMAVYTDSLAFSDVTHVYVPEKTYIYEETEVCGCFPEYFSETVLIESSGYSIEADCEGETKIRFAGNDITADKDGIWINSEYFTGLNIAAKADSSGNFYFYSLK